MSAPLTAEKAIRYAETVCADPAAAVARWKALTGAKAVGCFPVYLPEEVLDAAGMLPVTLWGDEGPAPTPATSPLVCSAARGALAAARGPFGELLDAFAIPSTCEALRHVASALDALADSRPRFPLDFPRSGELPGASADLLDRIEAFREWAGEISGATVADGALDRSIRTYEEGRRLFGRLEERMAASPGEFSGRECLALVRAASCLPGAAHAELLLAALSRPGKGPGRPPRARVFLSGMMATVPVMDALDAAGAAVVGDDLARGHRSRSTPTPEIGDPPVALVRRHEGREPCPILHGPGRNRIDHLFSRAAACGADRVLALQIVGCEAEAADLPGLEAGAKARGVPFMSLDIDLSAPRPPGLGNRIEAFVGKGRA